MVDKFYDTIIYNNRYKYILEGLKNTLVIASFAVLIGLLLGTLIALIKNKNKESNSKKTSEKLPKATYYSHKCSPYSSQSSPSPGCLSRYHHPW